MGSYAVSLWFAEFRWFFIVATFVFVAGALYYKRNASQLWERLLLYTTCALGIGLVLYSLRLA